MGNFEHKQAMLVLDGSSTIEANAIEGAGGTIDIQTDFFLGSKNNITASSETKGLEGTVRLNSPDTDVINKLLVLPSNFIDAPRILAQPCAQRSDTDVIHFMVRHYETLPQSPHALWDYIPDSIRPEVVMDTDTATTMHSNHNNTLAFQDVNEVCSMR